MNTINEKLQKTNKKYQKYSKLYNFSKKVLKIINIIEWVIFPLTLTSIAGYIGLIEIPIVINNLYVKYLLGPVIVSNTLFNISKIFFRRKKDNYSYEYEDLLKQKNEYSKTESDDKKNTQNITLCNSSKTLSNSNSLKLTLKK